MTKNSEEMGGSLDDLFFSDNSKVVEENEVELLNNQTSLQKKIQNEGFTQEGIHTKKSENSLEVLFAEEEKEDISNSSKPFSKNSRMEFRRKAAEEASLGKQEAVRQAESARIQSEYRVPEHLWGNVDRVLGIVVNDSELQAVVNRFELTRDKEIDMLQRKTLQDAVSPKLLDAKVSIQNPLDVKATFDLVYDELIGISVIGPLWRDESITEVMVDGWNQVTIEKGGLLYQTPIRFRDMRHAERVARDLASKVSDRQLSPVSPLLTAPLPGARITFCYGSVVSSGLSITLRKFPVLLGMDGLLKMGSLSLDMARFLQICVESRATVLVSGGTGTGKTTMINALSGFIPDTERVITIEDAFELNLANKNWVALQTKEKASGDDTVIISQDMLLVNTLRMRPDRIIVGEIREGNGATVMLRAATTGHDGTMTTIHANDPETALNERLVDMVREVNKAPDEVVKRAVSRAVNLVVQVTRENKKRYISSIAVVDRSCIKDGNIIPDEIYRGRMSKDGVILYEQVGKVRAETELGEKISQAGFSKEIWGE
jgi:pilus assembly protein CpaF